MQDCLRYGYGSIWAAGMPWKLINSAIDEKFTYSVSKDCERVWGNRTELEWDNTSDPLEKEVDCPSCDDSFDVPWTTCGLPKDYDGDRYVILPTVVYTFGTD